MAFLNLESSGDAPWNLGLHPWTILRRGFHTVPLDRSFDRWQPAHRVRTKMNVAINRGICMPPCRSTLWTQELKRNIYLRNECMSMTPCLCRSTCSSVSDSRKSKNPAEQMIFIVEVSCICVRCHCLVATYKTCHIHHGEEEKWRSLDIPLGLVNITICIHWSERQHTTTDKDRNGQRERTLASEISADWFINCSGVEWRESHKDLRVASTHTDTLEQFDSLAAPIESAWLDLSRMPSSQLASSNTMLIRRPKILSLHFDGASSQTRDFVSSNFHAHLHGCTSYFQTREGRTLH
jgi:hypothetical protein